MEDRQLRMELVKRICDHCNDDVLQVAGDALRDLLYEVPEEAVTLLTPIAEVSEMWLIDLAHAALEIEREPQDLAELLTEFERRSNQEVKQ